MSFATTQDVGARLRRDLTGPEEEQAELLLEQATLLIADAASKDSDWVESFASDDDVPRVLWVICVELVARSLDNPSGYQSVQETLGLYSKSVRWSDSSQGGGGGLFLSDREVLMVRRAVNGTLAGSVRVDSIISNDWLCS